MKILEGKYLKKDFNLRTSNWMKGCKKQNQNLNDIEQMNAS